MKWKTWSTGIIDSTTDPPPQGVCWEISPLGFTSLLLTNTLMLIWSHPKEENQQKCFLSAGLRALSRSLKILQTPFGGTPMNFIQDWGHMGLFIAAEKRPRLTNIDFLFSFWWKSKANYSLLVGGWVGPKSPSKLETWVKITGSSCWPNCFVCLLWLPPEVLYGDCVACYAYLRIWIQTQFAEYKTHTKLGFSFVLWFNTAKFCVDFPKLSNIIAPYCLPCVNSLA